MEKLKRYDFITNCGDNIEWGQTPTGRYVFYLEVAVLEKKLAEAEDDRDTIYADMNRIVPELWIRIEDLEEAKQFWREMAWDMNKACLEAEDRADRAEEMARVFAVEPESGGWISVEDRSPESIGYYWCWDGPYSGSTGLPTLGFFTDGLWETNIAQDWTDVTHWMPLPKPPS